MFPTFRKMGAAVRDRPIKATVQLAGTAAALAAVVGIAYFIGKTLYNTASKTLFSAGSASKEAFDVLGTETVSTYNSARETFHRFSEAMPASTFATIASVGSIFCYAASALCAVSGVFNFPKAFHKSLRKFSYSSLFMALPSVGSDIVQGLQNAPRSEGMLSHLSNTSIGMLGASGLLFLGSMVAKHFSRRSGERSADALADDIESRGDEYDSTFLPRRQGRVGRAASALGSMIAYYPKKLWNMTPFAGLFQGSSRRPRLRIRADVEAAADAWGSDRVVSNPTESRIRAFMAKASGSPEEWQPAFDVIMRARPSFRNASDNQFNRIVGSDDVGEAFVDLVLSYTEETGAAIGGALGVSAKRVDVRALMAVYNTLYSYAEYYRDQSGISDIMNIMDPLATNIQEIDRIQNG